MEKYSNFNWYEKHVITHLAMNDELLKEAGFLDKALLWAAMLTIGGLTEMEASAATKTNPQQIATIMNNPKIKSHVVDQYNKHKKQVETAVGNAKGHESAKMGPIEDVVARTLYAEAQGESLAGKRAVASSIWNRANGNPQALVSVIKKPKQYSCWNAGRPPVGKGQAWEDCVAIAKEMAGGTFVPTVKYKYYFNPKKCRPSWAYSNGALAKDHLQIGNHLFVEPAKQLAKNVKKHKHR